MKRFLSILLTICMLLSALPAIADSNSGEMQVVNCTSYVSLRESPSTGAAVLARVSLGERVTDCESAPNGFIKCNYNGMTGYILDRYLMSTAEPVVITLPDQQVINCSSWVSLRAYPDTSAQRLAEVPLGAVVGSCTREGNYIKCTYNGQTGYILADYLTEYKGQSVSPTSAPAPVTLPNQQVINCNSWVSLRARPSTSSQRLAEVPLGAVVENCTREGDYIKCSYNGQTGYILSKYLTEYSGQPATPTEAPTGSAPEPTLPNQQVINCTSWVSLRARPDTSSQRLIEVPLGAVVENCSPEGNYIKCTYNGLTGYILTKYLTAYAAPVDPTEAPATPTEAPTAAPDGTMPNQQVINCTSWVSLREKPDNTSTRIIEVPLGAIVANCTREGNYVKCMYNGVYGYIDAQYLKDADAAPAPTATALPKYEVINCNSWVSLREKADTTSTRLKQVPLGALVENCVVEGDYIKCTYDGATGYIRARYLMEHIEWAEDPIEHVGAFTFKPKVSSGFMREVFGSAKVEAWNNLVDAVMAGRDTFACKDSETFDWIFGQFRSRYFPLFEHIIDYPEDRNTPVKNGIAHFNYTVSRAEAKKRIAEFSRQVESTLDKVLEPNYSDFEKALALFMYFHDEYVYNYDNADKAVSGLYRPDPYTTFVTKSGICSELSKLYSYLLMQVGIDATTVMCGDHEWSYIRIKGKEYHVDPTFVLSGNGWLGYFMMTDSERANSGYSKNRYIYVSGYSQDHGHPDYNANDDTFKDMWSMRFVSFSPETDIIKTEHFDDVKEWVPDEYSYKGF